MVTETTPASGVSATTARSFLHRDHLGSVDTITDGIGAVAQRLSFDAWGKRREINWQAMSEPAILAFSTTLTTRGFTGHEMLDPVGLVHMNGRVYDPELGRFLSADPFVQDITNLQSWNRYAYVLNNPLSYTDPTGFLADIIALPEIVVIPSGSFDYIDRWMSGWYGAGGFGAGWYGGPAFGGPHPGFYWGGPGAGQPGVNAACVNCLSDGTMPDLFQLRVNGLDSTVIGLQNPAAAIKTQAYANMDGLGSLLDRMQASLFNQETILDGLTGSAKAVGNFIYDSFFYVDDAGPYPTGLCLGSALCGPGPLFEPDLESRAEATGFVGTSVVAGIIAGGKSGIWSSTKQISAARNALRHWNKHRAEFPELQNSLQYVKAARRFLQNPPAGTLTRTRSNGDVLRYDPATNTFGIMTNKGTPRTMFRPKQGIQYWYRQ